MWMVFNILNDLFLSLPDLMEQEFVSQPFKEAITILVSKMQHGKHLEINIIVL